MPTPDFNPDQHDHGPAQLEVSFRASCIAAFVVPGRPPLHSVGDGFQIHLPAPILAGICGVGGGFQGVQSAPGVAVGQVHQIFQGRLFQVHFHIGDAALVVFQCPHYYCFDLFRAEQLKGEDPRTGQQRADHLK